MKFNARLTRRHSLLLVPLYIALNLVPSATHSSLSTIRGLWTPPPSPPPQDTSIPSMQNLAEPVLQSLNAIQHVESPPTCYSQEILSWPDNEDRLGSFASIFDFVPICFHIAQSIAASPMSRPTPPELRVLPPVDLVLSAISPAIASSFSYYISTIAISLPPINFEFPTELFQCSLFLAILLVVLRKFTKRRHRLQAQSICQQARYLRVYRLKLTNCALRLIAYFLLLFGPTPSQLARTKAEISECETEIEKAQAEYVRNDNISQQLKSEITIVNQQLASVSTEPSSPCLEKVKKRANSRLGQLQDQLDDTEVAKEVENARINMVTQQKTELQEAAGWMGATLRIRELEKTTGTDKRSLERMEYALQATMFEKSMFEASWKKAKADSEHNARKADLFKAEYINVESLLEVAQARIAELEEELGEAEGRAGEATAQRNGLLRGEEDVRQPGSSKRT